MKQSHLSSDKRKQVGSHYTPLELADFVALKILSRCNQDKKSPLRLMDPAVGDGALLLSVLNKLPMEQRCGMEVIGFDTDREALDIAINRIREDFPEVICEFRCENFLNLALEFCRPTLFQTKYFEPVDIVIANPPYVRTQVLGAENAQKLADAFGLSGRVDLYYAFLQAIAIVLKPGGVAGIIVSNRFMSTKAGADVRENIWRLYNIFHIWDLGDTKLFEAAVLPAVLLVERKNGTSNASNPKFTSIYTVDAAVNSATRTDIFSALEENGVVQIRDGRQFTVKQGHLDFGNNPRNVWKLLDNDSRRWLEIVGKNTYCKFSDIGKIRVGVKTTADKVFIRDDWDELPEKMQPELLRPLTTHHIANRFKAATSDKPKQILYTHQVVAKRRVAVNLEDYPRSANYLNQHRDRLEGRDYVLKAGRNWFEIWVPQDPQEWSKPKLVFRDITERPTFWVDLTGSVVNGDCYWLTAQSNQSQDLLWLAMAVGNSTFIESFYDRKFNNKLYAGRRRFITQYVEQFPLPNPASRISLNIIDMAKKIFHTSSSAVAEQLEKDIDELVWESFGFSSRKSH